MRPPRSLSARLTLYCAFTFTLLLGGIFILLYWSIDSVLSERMDEDLREDITEFSELLETGGVQRIVSEIDNETIVDEDESVFLVLFDNSGKVKYSSQLDAWVGLSPDKQMIEEQLISDAEPRLSSLFLSSQDAETRVIYGRLSPDYVLLIGESMENRDDVMEILISAFALVSLLALPVSALLVWFVTRRTVSGIRMVSNAAHSIAAGNLDTRVKAHDQLEEVQTLADTFDGMANRIQSLVRQLREMTDNIAHDLRSPLGRIRLLSESVLHKEGGLQEYKENAESTIAECDRLIQMINVSLDVSEAEAGVLEFPRNNIDLSEVVNDACDFFEAVAEQKNISLKRNLPGYCPVNADRTSLQRMFSNLLDNAAKFTCSGGEIQVSMKIRDGMARISVKDNGIGIPAEHIRRVFDRFYRVEVSRNSTGCGLGLSYARAVARAYGGEISVESEAGKYSEFMVNIPVDQASDELPELRTCGHLSHPLQQ